ncbi:MAG: hypothetical protein KA260_03135 [Burkholderiales bacterium]|nr:hypothetical protein [Burkholderiales bacterium]
MNTRQAAQYGLAYIVGLGSADALGTAGKHWSDGHTVQKGNRDFLRVAESQIDISLATDCPSSHKRLGPI